MRRGFFVLFLNPERMSAHIPLLEARDRRAWRKWLERNHAKSSGVWLVYFKQHAGRKGVEYDDSVCEALCFGWVDSLIKRLDDDRYARKFTPRKPGSRWSSSNRERWMKMKKAGLLADAGLAAAPTDRDAAALPTVSGELAEEALSAIQCDPIAWRAFEALAPSHQRHYVLWIATAKKTETRERRAREAIAMLRAGKTLGLK
jgi:uncharacterized protein YdeI (YjbR/CyaY-like superfamily)